MHHFLCTDAVERFQLLMFLSLILLQDFAGWDSLWKILPTAGFVLLAECIVDYVKHCFIAKFNRLDSSVYKKFMAILGHDVVATRLNLPSTLDPTHSRGRRLGVPVVAMTCVVSAFLLLCICAAAQRATMLSVLSGFGCPLRSWPPLDSTCSPCKALCSGLASLHHCFSSSCVSPCLCCTFRTLV
jgi:hypothetical protein